MLSLLRAPREDLFLTVRNLSCLPLRDFDREARTRQRHKILNPPNGDHFTPYAKLIGDAPAEFAR
jgi:hypothetical protein